MSAPLSGNGCGCYLFVRIQGCSKPRKFANCCPLAGDRVADCCHLSPLRDSWPFVVGLSFDYSAMHTEGKLVTVLFADAAGAKADSGERHPQDALAGLTALPAQVEAIITAHAGTIHWRDGDGVGAIFGARQAQEEDAARAVRAALALQASLAEFQQGVSTSPLQLRIGIHTAMVAITLPCPARERTAADDTLALACRLPRGPAAGR